MKQLLSMSACDLSVLLNAREISSLELTDAFLGQIACRDDEIGAYLTVCADTAIQAAKAVDARRAKGEKLPLLAGIPMALKDNICTEGIRTTCASKMLSDFIPPYSATVYKRLLQNGAVLLGKLNMDEFAMGSTTATSAFRRTCNPHNTACVPGGSSGGCAAAVVADEAVYALGSDTGGSIRQPASFCGAVGLRPTYGRISRYGLVPYACSLDQIGILSKTVRDNAIILQAIAGKDENDFTASSMPVGNDCTLQCDNLHRLRIGVPRHVFLHENRNEVVQAVLYALHQLEQMGVQVVELPFELSELALQAYYILAFSEASCNLARYDGVRYGIRADHPEDLRDMYSLTRSEGFGSEVKRRILVGTYLLGETNKDRYYNKALQVRRQIKQVYADSFEMCDIIVTPTAPTTAYRFDARNADSVRMHNDDLYTVPASLAGLPALSVPCGNSKEGLPIGMQLTAPAFCEELLYRVSYVYEQECGHGDI